MESVGNPVILPSVGQGIQEYSDRWGTSTRVCNDLRAARVSCTSPPGTHSGR